MRTFARMVGFALISLVIAGVITGIAMALTAQPIPLETFAQAREGNRDASLLVFLDMQRTLGIVNLLFYPTILGSIYLLQRWWNSRHPSSDQPVSRGCLLRGLAAAALGFVVAAWLYGAYTLFIVLPSFPGSEASQSLFSNWVDMVDARATLVGLTWFITVGVYMWRSASAA